VKDRLFDSKFIGLDATTLALELLSIIDCDSASLIPSLVDTLEALAYLCQTSKSVDAPKSGSTASALLSIAQSAAAAMAEDGIEISSQPTYALQLGFSALYDTLDADRFQSASTKILSACLSCIQLVDDKTVHQAAMEVLGSVVDNLPARQRDAQATHVFDAITGAIALQSQVSGGINKSFFKSIICIVRPFLSHRNVKVSTWNGFLSSILDLSQSNQKLFFSLSKQIWVEEGTLKLLLKNILLNDYKDLTQDSLRDVASLVCEQYDCSESLLAFELLLADDAATKRGVLLERALTFILAEVQSKKTLYKVSSEKGSLIKQVIVKMDALGDDSNGPSNQSKARLAYGLLKKLLEQLDSICTVNEYAEAVSSLQSLSRSGADQRVQQKALKLLITKFKSCSHEPLSTKTKDAMLNTITHNLTSDKSSPAMKQHALLLFGSSLTYYKSGDVFAMLELALTVSAAEDLGKSPIIGDAMLVIGSSVQVLKDQAIPLVPRIAKLLLQCLEQNTETLKASTTGKDDSGTRILIQCGLYAMTELVGGLGNMVAPYLALCYSILNQILETSCSSSTDLLVDKSKALIDVIARRVPVRLSLPLLLGAMENCECPPSIKSDFAQSLGVMIGLMDHSDAAFYHHQIVDFLLSAFDSRRDFSIANAEYAMYESVLTDVLSSLVVKLSESSFRPVFLHILDWSSKGADGADGRVMRGKLARRITLFHIVIKLTTKLRSIFVPYFKHLVEVCTELLECSTPLELIGGGPGPSKKKKGTSAESESDAATGAMWVLRLEIIHALKRCFLYDNVGFADESKFEELLPVILSSMSDQPSESVCSNVLNTYARQVLDIASIASPELVSVDRRVEFNTLDIIARETADCLVKMSAASNDDVLWKRFNSKVLMASRTECSRTKLVCIEVASQLATHLKEDYIVLIAETVPFVAELMEDRDPSVTDACKKFVRTVEEISGEEDLQQYL